MLTAGPLSSGDAQTFLHIQFGKIALGFKKDEEEKSGADKAGVSED